MRLAGAGGVRALVIVRGDGELFTELSERRMESVGRKNVPSAAGRR